MTQQKAVVSPNQRSGVWEPLGLSTELPALLWLSTGES